MRHCDASVGEGLGSVLQVPTLMLPSCDTSMTIWALVTWCVPTRKAFWLPSLRFRRLFQEREKRRCEKKSGLPTLRKLVGHKFVTIRSRRPFSALWLETNRVQF